MRPNVNVVKRKTAQIAAGHGCPRRQQLARFSTGLLAVADSHRKRKRIGARGDVREGWQLNNTAASDQNAAVKRLSGKSFPPLGVGIKGVRL